MLALIRKRSYAEKRRTFYAVGNVQGPKRATYITTVATKIAAYAILTTWGEKLWNEILETGDARPLLPK